MGNDHFCPGCGRARQADEKFCAGCGKQFGSSWFASPDDAVIGGWIAFGIGLLSAVVILWYIYGAFAGQYVDITRKIGWIIATGYDVQMGVQDWIVLAAIAVLAFANRIYREVERACPNWPERPKPSETAK